MSRLINGLVIYPVPRGKWCIKPALIHGHSPVNSPPCPGAFSYPEPFLRAVRRGALAKSISNWHLIGYNEGYCSNTGYIILPCFYGIRFWPEPLVAPRVRRALGTRMVPGFQLTSALPSSFPGLLAGSREALGTRMVHYTNSDNLVPRACDPREGTRGSGIIRCRKPGILAKIELRTISTANQIPP